MSKPHNCDLLRQFMTTDRVEIEERRNKLSTEAISAAEEWKHFKPFVWCKRQIIVIRIIMKKNT